MGHVEFPNDLTSVCYFVKTRVPFFQLALWIADCLDISVILLEICTQHCIDRTDIRKVIGFEHVHEKVHGCPRSLTLVENCIKGEAISVEDLLYIFRSFPLEIVNQDDKPGF